MVDTVTTLPASRRRTYDVPFLTAFPSVGAIIANGEAAMAGAEALRPRDSRRSELEIGSFVYKFGRLCPMDRFGAHV
jgi:hypothetical protein